VRAPFGQIIGNMLLIRTREKTHRARLFPHVLRKETGAVKCFFG